MQAKQATTHPKLVTQLERHACFCPPTMHDTKLDQLNKVRVEAKASIAKVKSMPSHKASTFPSPISGLATIKQPGQATILQASAHCESKGGPCHQASNQQAAMQKPDTKNCLTPKRQRCTAHQTFVSAGRALIQRVNTSLLIG